MFQNKYAAATSQLQDLIKAHPKDAKDHATYALVLNYQTKQKPALDEAVNAQKLAPNDGFVLTVLTRVEDWNDDIQGAARDGAAAIKAAPNSALARAFYAEALADVGRYAEAQTQLQKGADLAKKGTDYDRAEVERNWSNYYRDKKDYTQASTISSWRPAPNPNGSSGYWSLPASRSRARTSPGQPSTCSVPPTWDSCTSRPWFAKNPFSRAIYSTPWTELA